MLKTNDILKSIEFVVKNSKHVKINQKNIKQILKLISNEKKDVHCSNLNIKSLKEEEKILFFLICNSLSFCFWRKPKWKMEYEGKEYSGYFGIFNSIAKAVNENKDILDINYLKNISIDEFNYILRGTATIPLLGKRYDILKELIEEIEKVGNLYNLFLQAKSDEELLKIILDNFSNFKDVSIYKGVSIYFLKKAYLLVEDLYNSINQIKDNIKNTFNLLAGADYKLPQVLREFGIFEYSNELKELIDNKIELKHDSEMEIELRANTIYAVELIRKVLNAKGIKLSSMSIGTSIWLLSKKEEYKNHPYHLTETIYY